MYIFLAALSLLSTCLSVDEMRDDWRPLFYERFSPLVQSATGISEAALLLNQNIWPIWNITFKANQTPNIMSPSQVWIAAVHATSPQSKTSRQGFRRYRPAVPATTSLGEQGYMTCVVGQPGAGDSCRACFLHRAEYIPNQCAALCRDPCSHGR